VQGVGGDAEDAFFSKASGEGKVAAYVELLRFKSLAPGVKLWAVVLEVTPRGLTLGLPHGMRGNVPASEVRARARARRCCCCADPPPAPAPLLCPPLGPALLFAALRAKPPSKP